MIDLTTAREVQFAPANPDHARRALVVLRMHFEDFGHETLFEDDLFATDVARLVANVPGLRREAVHVLTNLGVDVELFEEQLEYFLVRPDEAAIFEEHPVEQAQYHGLRPRDKAMIALQAETGRLDPGFIRLDNVERVYFTADGRLFARF